MFGFAYIDIINDFNSFNFHIKVILNDLLHFTVRKDIELAIYLELEVY